MSATQKPTLGNLRCYLDTRFLLQGSIELADQSSRLEAHVNRSSEFGRYKSADKARTKPLSLRNRNRRSTHLAPNHVDAFRCIPAHMIRSTPCLTISEAWPANSSMRSP